MDEVRTPSRGAGRRLLTAALDLLLPQQCVGCAAFGTALCCDCARPLAGPPRRVAPDPEPRGFPPTWAVTAYDGVVREAVVAHKEEGRRDLAPMLAAALAGSLSAAAASALDSGRRCAAAGPTAAVWAGPDAARRLVVVPVPSRRSSVRSRGDDPTLRLARLAAATLSTPPAVSRPVALTVPPSASPSASHDGARLVRALRHARGVADQAGLDARARGANLSGALVVRRGADVEGAAVVVVDDIVTTGATLTEATRALRAAGAHSVTAAVVAATARRAPSRGT